MLSVILLVAILTLFALTHLAWWRDLGLEARFALNFAAYLIVLALAFTAWSQGETHAVILYIAGWLVGKGAGEG